MIEFKLRSSVILRMIIVAGMTLGLLIPTFFVQFLVEDRMERRDAAIAEVSQSWGGSQTLTGPILTLPYRNPEPGLGRPPLTEYIHLLPSRLAIQATLSPEIRYRGIYEVGLYNASVNLQGEFPPLKAEQLGVDPAGIMWNEASLRFGISDLKGVKEGLSLTLDGTKRESEPGVMPSDGIDTGITWRIKLSGNHGSHPFSLTSNLNGSSEIRFVPVGEITRVSLDSPWNDPSFIGRNLPDKRTVDASGVRAEWNVLNLNRNYPQQWKGNKYNLPESSFGMRLFLPVDEYQKTSRTIKYAILFIALTFLAFFISEIIARVILHPIQYALIGLSLVIFYVLLLSLTEHIPFNAAYTISSLLVIGLITLYSRWITHKHGIAFIIAIVLVILYTFLFVTLQLQDYALLVGSLGLFLVLLLTMYLTRNVDWFALNRIVEEKR